MSKNGSPDAPYLGGKGETAGDFGSSPALGIDKFIEQALPVLGDYIESPSVMIELHHRLDPLRKRDGSWDIVHINTDSTILIQVLNLINTEYLQIEEVGPSYHELAEEIIYCLALGSSELEVQKEAVKLLKQVQVPGYGTIAMDIGMIGRFSPHAEVQVAGLDALGQEMYRQHRQGVTSEEYQLVLDINAGTASHPESKLTALKYLESILSLPWDEFDNQFNFVESVAKIILTSNQNRLDESVVSKGVEILGNLLIRYGKT